MVDERIGGVGLTDGRVARQERRVDGDVGDLVEVEQAEHEVVAADAGPRAPARSPARGGLDEAGGDDAAERVADRRRAGDRGGAACASSATSGRSAHDPLDVVDQALLALGAAVAPVVGGHDLGAVLDEVGGDVLVAPVCSPRPWASSAT